MKLEQRLAPTIAAVAALTVFAAPSGSSVPQDTPETVRRAIEAGNATWERAFRSADATLIASTFDTEGINVGTDGSCTKGPAAIESVMRAFLQGSGPATKTRVQIGNIVLDGDLAYEWGRSEFHFAPKPGGPTERAGRYLAVWKRQADGGWKLFRNLGLSD